MVDRFFRSLKMSQTLWGSISQSVELQEKLAYQKLYLMYIYVDLWHFFLHCKFISHLGYYISQTGYNMYISFERLVPFNWTLYKPREICPYSKDFHGQYCHPYIKYVALCALKHIYLRLNVFFIKKIFVLFYH